MAEGSKKKTDFMLKEEDLEKALNSVKLHSVKVDFSPLESVLRFLNSNHRLLVKKVAGIEHRIEQDDRMDIMSEQIKQLENSAMETRVSLSNIQTKLIEIEKNQLKYDDRIKTLEKEMKVSRHTEKQLDAKIKTEIKTIQKMIKALDASFQNQLYKKCKPIEDKVNIILGTVDDLENEIESLRETINSIEITEKDENGEMSTRMIKKLKPETKDVEKPPSRNNLFSQVLESEISRLREEYNSRFDEFESRFRQQTSKFLYFSKLRQQ
jgi:chromosome segregation ATPase